MVTQIMYETVESKIGCNILENNPYLVKKIVADFVAALYAYFPHYHHFCPYFSYLYFFLGFDHFDYSFQIAAVGQGWFLY